MRELVEFLCRSLVERPEDVSVTEVELDGALTLQIRVAPADTGRVIGRQGRVIEAIRTLARAGGRTGRRVVVQVLE